ncbi:GntR family transcriptional regulator [Sinanaerobacter chloroacetimidivorans]|jgi:GntR family transcriptional regulator|uniref:GntR family transcriptional regulator n=1 Tax=Sinanaerobacter chloroacetimidivorans TaxID=2818044 RepID=A0A8J8B121_9FIRM|nr:GntR family transcriptional regulator [Sinanaerobacter chloroacetimidivorans]MBR0598238.1 GntR family transcriptional regulator [Sinanaerobacter chloroacetimidivorans]
MYMEPLYYKVKKDIEQKITEGAYKKGDFIPSEPELEQYYKVSRTTVRKAINMLVEEGYLTIVRGMGTKVTPSKLKHKGAELMSFTELMKRQGMVPEVRDIQIRRIHPDQEVLEALELKPWEEVYEIFRVRTADGEPITINTSYIPYRLVENRDLSVLKDKQSLYQVLEDFNILVQNTEDTMSAVKASQKQAEILQISKNDPLLYIERTAYDRNDRIIEFSRIAIRADRYKHIITLRRR